MQSKTSLLFDTRLQSCFLLLPLSALQAVQRHENASSHLALSRIGTVKERISLFHQ